MVAILRLPGLLRIVRMRGEIFLCVKPFARRDRYDAAKAHWETLYHEPVFREVTLCNW